VVKHSVPALALVGDGPEACVNRQLSRGPKCGPVGLSFSGIVTLS
jgi:hypothetical protein